VRLKNRLETDRVRSSYDGGMTEGHSHVSQPLKVEVMNFNLFDLDAWRCLEIAL